MWPLYRGASVIVSSVDSPLLFLHPYGSRVGCKGRAPFSAASGGFGFSGGFRQGAGLKSSDWVLLLSRVGFAFLRLRALAGFWSRILGVVRPGRDGSLIFTWVAVVSTWAPFHGIPFSGTWPLVVLGGRGHK